MSTALARSADEGLARLGDPAELIPRMKEAVASLDAMEDAEEVGAVWRDADIMHVAARRAKADAVEVAAAELRLNAERRLGEIFMTSPQAAGTKKVKDSLSGKEIAEFKALARIPRRYQRPEVAEALDAAIAGRKPRVKYETVDLFAESVEHQLKGRSHTPRAVWLTSRQLGAKPTRYRHTWESWDGTHFFHYPDPKSGRIRTATCDGTLQEALQLRGELSGRIPSVKALLPIRGSSGLGVVLDSVRQGRAALDDFWPKLTEGQKRELDGAYSTLDDLAASLVRAANL